MRSVRRGEAAYLELMREAKAQFDAEIAKNKEKGKAGRPRKEVAPVVVEDDDIEIDFSDVVSVEEAEAVAEVVPAKAVEKKEVRKAAPVVPTRVSAMKKAPVKKASVKKAPAKKAAAKKTPAKKTHVKAAPPKKAATKKAVPRKR